MQHKLVRHPLSLALILIGAAGLIALTWTATLTAIARQHAQAEADITAHAERRVRDVADALNRQLLDIDQSLRMVVGAWQYDPAHFDLQAWQSRAVALRGISGGMQMLDEHGRIIQSTVPPTGGLDASGAGKILSAIQLRATGEPAYVGPATVDPLTRRWHMTVARAVRHPDGSLAGVIVTDWRVEAITGIFAAADIGRHPLGELVGLSDGKLRAVAGPPAGAPDTSIAGTPMFAALKAAPDGTWVGHSAPDDVERVHAFQQIPGRALDAVVGVDLRDALAPVEQRAAQARLFAGSITALIAILGLILIRSARKARQQRDILAHERTVLVAANAELEAAKTLADAKTAQLEATLNGMSDGVAMVDADLRLVQWNRLFPALAGVPEHILRVGLPMEEILRAQASAGQFGAVDVEAEVARRMTNLRLPDNAAVVERTRPDGGTLELRRNHMPDGGFVTLYRDVTTRKLAETALREARRAAEAANEAKSHFTAIVSHEIRSPLSALLSTLTVLADGGLTPTQQALLSMARRSGDALEGLINDILEMSRMEAGQLSLRPGAFDLRGLLDGVVSMFSSQAADRGIALRLSVAPDLPGELYADPGRVRQVLINLLSNAVKFSRPGAVTVLARQEYDLFGHALLHIAVRDPGPVIAADDRDRLFRPFSRLDQPGDEGSRGSGLGLAISRQIVSMMGGDIGCDAWAEPRSGAADEVHAAGNEFWVRLPIVLPAEGMDQLPVLQPPAARRILPRTRILLVEDVPANQLVTATLLRREGHLVDTADDGTAGLRAVAMHAYDIVFMDIFLPDMSGLDVARRIRLLPPPAGTVPMVALTANVSSDDQRMCSEVDMNGVLNKPVALPELLDALAIHVWPGIPERMAGPAVARPRAEPGPVLADDRVGELRRSLPRDLLAEMVEECLVDLHVRLPALRRAVASGSREAVLAQAHAMMGMAGGYGMAALEARLRGLMEATRRGDSKAAADLAAGLDTELSGAAAALRSRLAIETPPR
jgi:signal transduction histidine kinase/CheY-like chemotaxis protein